MQKGSTVVALALNGPPAPTAPRARPAKESDFSIVPHAVAHRSQRREEGGFTISARAVGLYAVIRKHCFRQARARDGKSCEVSVATLAAAAGVKVRQARNLRAQLVQQGIITVELERGKHGTNVYHLVLPVPPAVEQLLPGRPARTPGPHYVVTPALPPNSHPGKKLPPPLDLGVGFDLDVEVSSQPTPERLSGAGTSGPALSAAERPAAPGLHASGTRAQHPAAPGARRDDDTAAPRAVEAGGASRVPAQKHRDDVKTTRRVVELWPDDDDKRRDVMTRFLRLEYPGIPDATVVKTLDALRAAQRDAASGGRPVRSPWRYCAKVAARILAQARALSGPVLRGSGGPEPAAGVFLRPATTAGNGPALSQGEHNAALSTEASKIDTCPHGVSLDEECPTCDHRAPLCFLRAVRRQQLRPGRGTRDATRVAPVEVSASASASEPAAPSPAQGPTTESPRR